MAAKKKSKAIELGHTPPKGSNTGSPGGNAPIYAREVGKTPGIDKFKRGEYANPDYLMQGYPDSGNPKVGNGYNKPLRIWWEKKNTKFAPKTKAPVKSLKPKKKNSKDIKYK